MEKYRIDQSNGLEFGLYTLGDHIPTPHSGERISAQQRLQEIIGLAKLAEQAGIHFFSVGESHQEYFTTQAHTVVLAAIAQATDLACTVTPRFFLFHRDVPQFDRTTAALTILVIMIKKRSFSKVKMTNEKLLLFGGAMITSWRP